MSQLFLSESGHVIPTLCEELTCERRARKVLTLPHTEGPATLWFLARAYPGCTTPIRVSVNGFELEPLQPQAPYYLWYSASIQADKLRSGENRFELWTSSPVMNGWSLALEDGHRDPRSYLSTDAGRTWQSEKMGYLHVCRAEYLVRVRLVEGQNPAPPAIRWENPAHPRIQHFRSQVPQAALAAGSTMERVRALTAWISSSWEYRNSGQAAQYAPWDPQTILAWGQSQSGHDGRLPMVMCVHYAVTMIAACQAAGLAARPAVFTGEINGFTGHFTTEVWFPEHRKWVFVDPNLDAVLCDGPVPMSVNEIQAAGNDLTPFVQWGPGTAFQRRNPAMDGWIRDIFLPSRWSAHRAVWPRTDFYSHPEFSPPGHGATAYCETSLVWEKKDLDQGFGMFPNFGSSNYFDAPPV
jgi:transglutaminase-like putative cysteine protease